MASPPPPQRHKLLLCMAALMLVLALFPVTADAYFSAIAVGRQNGTLYLPAVTSGFGPMLSKRGDDAVLASMPVDGCKPDTLSALLDSLRLLPRFVEHRYADKIYALFPRGNCTFDQKVYAAQLAGAAGAIIYDHPASTSNNDIPPNTSTTLTASMGDDKVLEQVPRNISAFYGLVHMTAARYGDSIRIPSLFVSNEHAVLLRQLYDASVRTDTLLPIRLLNLDDGTVVTPTSGAAGSSGNRAHFLSPDLVIFYMVAISISSLCSIISVVSHMYYRIRLYQEMAQRARKNRITAQELELVPVVSIDQGHTYVEDSVHAVENGAVLGRRCPMCAICLEEMELGVKVRALPCSHLFHVDCVDDWLLLRHRTCPTCRQEVVVDGRLNDKLQQKQKQKRATSSALKSPTLRMEEGIGSTGVVTEEDREDMEPMIVAVGSSVEEERVGLLQSGATQVSRVVVAPVATVSVTHATTTRLPANTTSGSWAPAGAAHEPAPGPSGDYEDGIINNNNNRNIQ